MLRKWCLYCILTWSTVTTLYFLQQCTAVWGGAKGLVKSRTKAGSYRQTKDTCRPSSFTKKSDKAVVKHRQKSKEGRQGTKTNHTTIPRATVPTLPAQMEEKTIHFHFSACRDVQLWRGTGGITLIKKGDGLKTLAHPHQLRKQTWTQSLERLHTRPLKSTFLVLDTSLVV